MDMSPAPFHSDVAGGPDTVQTYWIKTADSVRLRLGYWPCENARGTLLLLPGRTEYLEKYGITAAEFARLGYAVLTVDWRGQGLSDRLYEDRRVGHVHRFQDFQTDLAALRAAADTLDVPRPFHLLGHSMGGAIGLRAAMNGIDVKSCVFTGPMWGIYMSTLVRPFGWVLPPLAIMVGQGMRLAPTTKFESYLLANPFEDNMLTTDAGIYAMMRRQLETHPDLALGGPSLIWLRESLLECRDLASRPSPDLPCLTVLGSNERIVDCPAVHDRMRRWPNGELYIAPGGEHEVLQERPEIRGPIFEKIGALFAAAEAAPPRAATA